ncbi:MAG TPA: hypothetical protein VGX28_03860 [Frankiaceae bacterium]|jgi:hypothetical protein|nr:hypothetical protein [Frankiaceae bacterium]
MNPEDRLRSAMEERAGAARTSPDALDGVFTRVARHRRNVRIAAAAGSAMSIAAVVLVANAAIGGRGGADVVPASPTPTVAASSAAGTPTPTASASPTASPEPTDSVTAIAVALPDRRLVLMDGATGTVLRTIATLRSGEHPVELSPTHRWVVVAPESGCTLTLVEVATGDRTTLRGQRVARFSPRDARLAYAGCADSAREGTPVVVRDMRTGTERTLASPRRPANWPQTTQFMDELTGVEAVSWRDDDVLVVSRAYEDYTDTLTLDVRTADDLGDSRRYEGAAVHFTYGGRYYGVHACCYPDWDQRAQLVEWTLRESGSTKRTVMAAPDALASGGVDGSGALVYVDNGDLWRWSGWNTDEGPPVRVARGFLGNVAT